MVNTFIIGCVLACTTVGCVLFVLIALLAAMKLVEIVTAKFLNIIRVYWLFKRFLCMAYGIGESRRRARERRAYQEFDKLSVELTGEHARP